MGASTPESGLSRLLRRLLVAALLPLPAASLSAQIPAEPVLEGRVLVNGTPSDAGTVVLHRVSDDFQGEVDSVATGPAGDFSFRLPAVPDPERGDIYFASVRYAGILYFGEAVRLAVQLDSVYRIEAYDTLSVAEEGRDLPVQTRNVFLEPVDGGWQVTDLLQVRNDGDRTLVSRGDGAVWRYPLAVGSTDHEMGQGVQGDAVTVEGEELVVRTPMAPGERLFVVRYRVPDPFLELPLPGRTEGMELLIREPAPPLTTQLLTAVESVELEEGSTYRRLTGQNLTGVVLRLEEGAGARRIPAEWLAVVLALVLAGFGVLGATRAAPAGATPEPESETRRSLLLEVARMDEAYEALDDPSEAEQTAYERRRRELLRRLRLLS